MQNLKNDNQETKLISAMNPTFQVEEKDASATSSTIIIEPLENGYGHTLGNALRRVLLSSLPGTAITQFRVAGADHQFSTIDGLKEDVLEMALNIKQIKVFASTREAGVLKLSVKGPKEVTAADIECEAGFEIINKEMPIATIAKGKTLEVEMRVESGTGYVIADEKNALAIGDIVLDALYSPVVKVSYKVEQTRVGRITDFDKLILSVQTDGSISPMDAVQLSAKILTKQFSQVFNPVVPEVVEPEISLSPEEAETLRLTVEELDLPTRIANALRKGGFKTVGDLTGAPKDVVSKVKNLGGKSVVLIDAALAKKGVSLGE
ncbi:DNA-directed RNA polymerase subunit alpha [Candidatus Woesebacteria bacterium]|nr:DNA-directed RNA polymerase subunit alpha [Candidatus Woesebacteria bacterium]